MILLPRLNKGDPMVRRFMAAHYSAPKGFVGRQRMYGVFWNQDFFGLIGWGSVTKHLPGRTVLGSLNNGLANTFYHLHRHSRAYPIRNFSVAVLQEAQERAAWDFEATYGDPIRWFETLVELPRTGELYRRAGWTEVGVTKGLTCKRVAGESTDGWSGRRVWDTSHLRPKRVFYKVRDEDPKC